MGDQYHQNGSGNGYAPQGYPQQQRQAVYVGSGKWRQVSWGNGWELRLSFSVEDLERMRQSLNENGWVSIDVKERREPSQSGATHYGQVDFWQPQRSQNGGGNGYPPPQYQQPPRQYRQPDDGGFGMPPQQQQYQQYPPRGSSRSASPPPGQGRPGYGNDLPPQRPGNDDDIPF